MAHINSFVRIPLIVLRQRVRALPRVGVLDEDSVRMRVWPNDIDFNFHLNNSRFLSCMDYGRMHWVAATGMMELVVRERWTPLVGSGRDLSPVSAAVRALHADNPDALLG